MNQPFGWNQPLNIIVLSLISVLPLFGGTSPDEVRTFNQIKNLAETGESAAQFKVGQAYFSGEGVVTDVVEGAKWYRLKKEILMLSGIWRWHTTARTGKAVRISAWPAGWILVFTKRRGRPQSGGLWRLNKGTLRLNIVTLSSITSS
jgi:hypothetical protein